MKINVTINKDGTVDADMVNGPGGIKCLDVLGKLFAELGSLVDESKKDEFYQAEIVNTQNVEL